MVLQRQKHKQAVEGAAVANQDMHIVDSTLPTSIVVAGGHRISAEVADQAADWLTILMSDDVSAQQRLHWQQWRDLHPDHAHAWQHIEAVTGRLHSLAPQAGYQVLSAVAQPVKSSRRKALGVLGLVLTTATTAALVRRTESWQAHVADVHTETGEQRKLALKDGTELTLNTATAVNPLFNSEQRLLQLVRGELLIRTHQQSDEHRPFIVQTAQGFIRALGTQFVVRSWGEGQTHVAVQAGAVEVRPLQSAQAVVVSPGQQLIIDQDRVLVQGRADANALAWLNGQLIAEDMPLDLFLGRLARHRPGMLRWDAQVAQLRLSGVYPLNDTDRILRTLHNVLPVQVVARTRYWVTVVPASV